MSFIETISQTLEKHTFFGKTDIVDDWQLRFDDQVLKKCKGDFNETLRRHKANFEEEKSLFRPTILSAYQDQILKASKQSNVVSALPTGCANTLISARLCEYMNSIESSSGKSILFIVDKMNLVFQQARVFCKETQLKISLMCGKGTKEEFDEELEKGDVVFLTANALLERLKNDQFSLKDVALLVLDEAHHALKKHPYKTLMTYWTDLPKDQRPKVFGMTASPLHNKPPSHDDERTCEMLQRWCNVLNGDLIFPCSRDTMLSLPRMEFVHCEPSPQATQFRSLASGHLRDVAAALIPMLPPKEAGLVSGLLKFDMLTIGSPKGIAKWISVFSQMEEANQPLAEGHFIHSTSSILDASVSHQLEILECMTLAVLVSPAAAYSRLLVLIGQLQETLNKIDFRHSLGGVLKETYMKTIGILNRDVPSATFRRKSVIQTILERNAERFEMYQDAKCLVLCNNKVEAQHVVNVAKSLRAYSPVLMSSDTHKSIEEMNEELESFRAKHKASSNILAVVGSVKEYLDMPDCCLIIRYDTIQTVKCLSQSRLSCRCLDATFIALYEEEIQMNDVLKKLRSERNQIVAASALSQARAESVDLTSASIINICEATRLKLAISDAFLLCTTHSHTVLGEWTPPSFDMRHMQNGSWMCELKFKKKERTFSIKAAGTTRQLAKSFAAWELIVKLLKRNELPSRRSDVSLLNSDLSRLSEHPTLAPQPFMDSFREHCSDNHLNTDLVFEVFRNGMESTVECKLFINGTLSSTGSAANKHTAQQNAVKAFLCANSDVSIPQMAPNSARSVDSPALSDGGTVGSNTVSMSRTSALYSRLKNQFGIEPTGVAFRYAETKRFICNLKINNKSMCIVNAESKRKARVTAAQECLRLGSTFTSLYGPPLKHDCGDVVDGLMYNCKHKNLNRPQFDFEENCSHMCRIIIRGALACVGIGHTTEAAQMASINELLSWDRSTVINHIYYVLDPEYLPANMKYGEQHQQNQKQQQMFKTDNHSQQQQQQQQNNNNPINSFLGSSPLTSSTLSSSAIGPIGGGLVPPMNGNLTPLSINTVDSRNTTLSEKLRNAGRVPDLTLGANRHDASPTLVETNNNDDDSNNHLRLKEHFNQLRRPDSLTSPDGTNATSNLLQKLTINSRTEPQSPFSPHSANSILSNAANSISNKHNSSNTNNSNNAGKSLSPVPPMHLRIPHRTSTAPPLRQRFNLPSQLEMPNSASGFGNSFISRDQPEIVNQQRSAGLPPPSNPFTQQPQQSQNSEEILPCSSHQMNRPTPLNLTAMEKKLPVAPMSTGVIDVFSYFTTQMFSPVTPNDASFVDGGGELMDGVIPFGDSHNSSGIRSSLLPMGRNIPFEPVRTSNPGSDWENPILQAVSGQQSPSRLPQKQEQERSGTSDWQNPILQSVSGQQSPSRRRQQQEQEQTGTSNWQNPILQGVSSAAANTQSASTLFNPNHTQQQQQQQQQPTTPLSSSIQEIESVGSRFSAPPERFMFNNTPATNGAQPFSALPLSHSERNRTITDSLWPSNSLSTPTPTHQQSASIIPTSTRFPQTLPSPTRPTAHQFPSRTQTLPTNLTPNTSENLFTAKKINTNGQVPTMATAPANTNSPKKMPMFSMTVSTGTTSFTDSTIATNSATLMGMNDHYASDSPTTALPRSNIPSVSNISTSYNQRGTTPKYTQSATINYGYGNYW
eukprot:TRINITY_DN599_c3_g1_i1.p1 TRINITY_DN599_c3_g1~~TRINITY_DN599_c3_g1_i1.p1  ORF type:complete len:1687 (+),score=527.87 TRINITY_DN599_c3_g1_i1:61-5121(+)